MSYLQERESAVFLVMVAGQIEYVELPEVPDVYCKYNFSYGQDWQGIQKGISQVAQRQTAETDLGDRLILNFPFELTFKSSSPHGWPQLVLSCYGYDFLGNDVVRGYGSVYVPLSPGRYTRKLSLFVPEATSVLQKFVGWIQGRPPEFLDSNFVSQSDGREITRVQSTGFVTVTFEVVQKNLKKLGYDVNAASTRIISEFPLNLPSTSNSIANRGSNQSQTSEKLSRHDQASIQGIGGTPASSRKPAIAALAKVAHKESPEQGSRPGSGVVSGGRSARGLQSAPVALKIHEASDSPGTSQKTSARIETAETQVAARREIETVDEIDEIRNL